MHLGKDRVEPASVTYTFSDVDKTLWAPKSSLEAHKSFTGVQLHLRGIGQSIVLFNLVCIVRDLFSWNGVTCTIFWRDVDTYVQ